MDASVMLQSMAVDVGRLLGAYLLAVPVGWNREREFHTMGIRTFPTVAIACCGLTLVAQNIPNAGPDSLSRILQGLVTGIGFVGGGALLRGKIGVFSASTAASIWNIGIVGASMGLGAYHIAITLALVNFLTLKLLAPVKRVIRDQEHSRSQE